MRVMDLIRKVFNLDESTTSSPSNLLSSSERQTPSVRDRYTPVIQDQIDRLTHISSNIPSLVGRTVLSYLPDVNDIDAIIDRGPLDRNAKEIVRRNAEYFDVQADPSRFGLLLSRALQS